MWIVGPVLVLIFVAFKFIIPFRIPDKYKEQSFGQLESEFTKVYRVSILIFLASIVLSTLAFIKIVGFITKPGVLPEGTAFEIGAEDIWFFAAMALGVGFGVVLLNLILKIWLKDSLEKFWLYYNLRYGFNALLIVNALTVLLLVAGLFFAILGTDAYVTFGNDAIKINKVLSIGETTYNYTDIKDLIFYQHATAPNGNVVEKPHYKIIFSDGTEWTTMDDMRVPKESDKTIFDFLSEKIGIAIKSLDVDE